MDRQASCLIGQALYTSSQQLPSGGQGEGFVAASPSLATELPWLDASSRPLIGFVGNTYKVTTAQRAEYRPIGRHLHANRVLIYVKANVGTDFLARDGNYMIHFLVASATALSLTDALRIAEATWIRDPAKVPYGRRKLGDLPDLDLMTFRAGLVSCPALVNAEVAAVQAAVVKLADEGLEISNWTIEQVLTILAVCPTWVDYAAALKSEWSASGPVVHLQLMSPDLADAILEDHRCELSGELRDLRQQLASARDGAELRAILAGRMARLPDSGKDAEAVAPASLRECLQKWVARTPKLTPAERNRVQESDVSDVLKTLIELGSRLPVWRNRDDLMASILRKCDTLDPQLLSTVLPLDDDSISRYVTVYPSDAILQAVVFLNRETSRRIELVFPTGVAAVMLVHLVECCRADPEFHAGLVRSVRISGTRSGSFVHRLLRCPGIDLPYLYSLILPQAAAERNELLWALAAINADAFAAWAQFPESYAGALLGALRHAEAHAQQRRFTRFTGKWS